MKWIDPDVPALAQAADVLSGERERERRQVHGDRAGTAYSESPKGETDCGSGTGPLPLGFQASWTTPRYSVASFAYNPAYSIENTL